MIGEYVQLSIIDEEQRFMRNVKPIPKDGHQWELQLRSTLANQQVQIALTETSRLPEGFRMYILDTEVDFKRAGFASTAGTDSVTALFQRWKQFPLVTVLRYWLHITHETLFPIDNR